MVDGGDETDLFAGFADAVHVSFGRSVVAHDDRRKVRNGLSRFHHFLHFTRNLVLYFICNLLTVNYFHKNSLLKMRGKGSNNFFTSYFIYSLLLTFGSLPEKNHPFCLSFSPLLLAVNTFSPV